MGALVKLIDRRFENLNDLQLPMALTGASLVGCEFHGCTFGATAPTPSVRRIVRSIEMRGCVVSETCSLGPVVVEDVLVEDLKTSGLVITYGAVFRNVILKGSCGRLMLNELPPSPHNDRYQKFREANSEYYNKVDWALDISEGEFDGLEIRNIPARLIRRNSETQALVRWERLIATEDRWRDLDLKGTSILNALTVTRVLSLGDRILVAPPRRSKKYARYAEALSLLRREGIAESE